MTQIPTSNDVKQLAHQVARDGLESHRAAIDEIARFADQGGRHPGAVEVLRDTTASDVVRARAFMTIARNWTDVAETASRWANFRQAFDAFITQWGQHQELRRGDNVEDLWTSRAKLDALRANMTLHRTLALKTTKPHCRGSGVLVRELLFD